MVIRIPSARSGKLPGAPTASIACCSRERNSLLPTCWPCRPTYTSSFDRYAAERFVYAVDHAKNATRKAKQAADILRSWDGRMSADSAAPTIEARTRVQLTRMLLEPKLGPSAK